MVASKPKSRTVHVLRGGQITIPIEFRRELGIEDASLMQVTLTEDGGLTLRSVEAKPRGSEWLRDVYDACAPVRLEGSTRDTRKTRLTSESTSRFARLGRNCTEAPLSNRLEETF